MLNRKLLLTTVMASAIVLPAANAIASGSTTLAGPADVKIEKAYAYVDSFPPSNRPMLAVVVKTQGQMPRRFDGLVRAGMRVGKAGGGSTGSVNGRKSRCYISYFPLRDGRLLVNGNVGLVGVGDGRALGPKASVGSRHVVTLSANDASGKTVSSSKSFTIKKRGPGDRSGKPAGC